MAILLLWTLVAIQKSVCTKVRGEAQERRRSSVASAYYPSRCRVER